MTTAQVQGHQDGFVDPPAEVPLLRAEVEVELAKAIEAGMYADHLLDHGEVRIVVPDLEAYERFVMEWER